LNARRNCFLEGDEDVVDAHVESCLAGALEKEREREREQEHARGRELQRTRLEAEEDIDIDGDGDDERGGYVGSVQGTGFHTRRRDDVDVEEDIDIDGDDAAVFGQPQFGEQDITGGAVADEDVDVDVDTDDDGAKTEVLIKENKHPVNQQSPEVCKSFEIPQKSSLITPFPAVRIIS
jgi:hypothetical protein